MRSSKSYLRKKFILLRKKNFPKRKKFNFHLIFKLIKKLLLNKKIVIAGYYPANYEVNILNFIKEAEENNFLVTLPVIESKNRLTFRLWKYKEPLSINNYGILEPKISNKTILAINRYSKLDFVSSMKLLLINVKKVKKPTERVTTKIIAINIFSFTKRNINLKSYKLSYKFNYE